ncbi:MAG: NUDIX domain-containing protein [Halobacteriales archaeon]|nr:NUDIX domain-containing protein [Halobacteriales archaeon]
METTRHFVATTYVVHDGATALHPHDKLGMWLPPGGHIDRDELPHEAAKREVREETGLDVELVREAGELSSETAESLPEPAAFLLEDIDVHDGRVAHQHIDFVFFGAVEGRAFEPEPGEAPAADWEWFSPGDLRERTDELAADVAELGQRAIEAVSGR